MSTKVKVALAVAPGVVATLGLVHAGPYEIAGIVDAVHRGVLLVTGGYGD